MGPVPGYYPSASGWWPSMASSLPPTLLPCMPSDWTARLFSGAPPMGQIPCLDPTHQYMRQALEQARSDSRLAQERVRQVRRRPRGADPFVAGGGSRPCVWPASGALFAVFL